MAYCDSLHLDTVYICMYVCMYIYISGVGIDNFF